MMKIVKAIGWLLVVGVSLEGINTGLQLAGTSDDLAVIGGAAMVVGIVAVWVVIGCHLTESCLTVSKSKKGE